jgi:HEAT repeat protein
MADTSNGCGRLVELLGVDDCADLSLAGRVRWRAAAEELARRCDEAVPALCAGMEHPSSLVRARCAQVLMRHGDAAAVHPLERLLAHRETEVRWRAAQVLGGIGSVRAVPALRRALLEDPERMVRAGAAAALGGIGCAGAVDALCRGLSEPNESVRLEVRQALVRIGIPALEPLRETLLRTAHYPTRARAAIIVGLIDPRGSINVLLRAVLEDQRLWEPVWHSLRLAGRAAAGPLAELLDDDDPVTRSWAARILGDVGDRQTVVLLVNHLRRDAPAVRLEAARSLLRLNDAAGLLAVAREGQQDPTEAVRLEAVEAARVSLDHQAGAGLVAWLQDGRVRLRLAVAGALAEYAERRPFPELQAAVPHLAKRASPFSGETRAARLVYREALRKIQALKLTTATLPLPAAAPAPDHRSLPRAGSPGE